MLLIFLPIFSQAVTTQSATPYPTSKSGVPTPLEAILTCALGLLIIFLIVIVLCIKKSSDNEAFGSLQALLVRPDV